MIHGIGTDIVAVKRMRAMWERHGSKALEKLLAPEEIASPRNRCQRGGHLDTNVSAF